MTPNPAYQQYVPRAGNVDPVGDGQPVLGVYYPERYGALGGAADDTAAVQAAVDAAQAVNGTVYLGQTYRITAEIVVSAPCTIDGAGANVLYGPRAVWGSDVTATVSPWLTGAVLLQTTAGANGLKITVVGNSVRLRNFGVRFADAIRFQDTGHGIVADPGAYLTYKNNGLDGSLWESVKVYGHDGDHYAFYLINAQLCTLVNCQGYGGGGVLWETNSAYGFYGNSTLVNPYVFMCAPGTAEGYYLHNVVAGHGTILMTFIRPQTFKVDFIAPENLADAATWLPDVNSIATGVQACFFADDDSFDINVIGPDMEPMAGGESIRLPNDQSRWLWTAGHCPGSQYDGVTIMGGTLKADALSIAGVSIPSPSGGHATMSVGSKALTGSMVALDGLTATLPAGTWDVTAVLRAQVASSGVANAQITDDGGTALGDLTLLYAFLPDTAQISVSVKGHITLAASTTIQVRAKVSSGAGNIANDSAGASYLIWEPSR
jgi:hypothetical protein